jgi:hypothetical protein
LGIFFSRSHHNWLEYAYVLGEAYGREGEMQRLMNQEMIWKYTSIGRTLDPLNYRTHLAIMLMTLVGGVIGGAITLLNGGDLNSAITAGFFMGASIFIAWVIAREVDPDNDYSAFVGAFLAGVFFVGRVDILSLSAVIILSRLINRVVGPPAKLNDSILALVLVGLSVLMGSWQMGLVGAIGYAMDASLSQPLRLHWIFALLALAISVGYVVLNGVTMSIAMLSTPYLVILIATTLLYGLVIIMTTRITTPCDMTSYRLDPRRVQATMLFLALGAIMTAVLMGENGVNLWVSAWATMAGVAVYRLTIARLVA